MEKYHIEKNTVQETLVIPLYGRKVCSDHFPHLFKDPEAERIINMLDYDFSEKGKKMNSVIFCDVIEERLLYELIKIIFAKFSARKSYRKSHDECCISWLHCH